MKKVIYFSLCLILGLIASQALPFYLNQSSYKPIVDTLLYVCLSFIMINVGREFKIDKTKVSSYTADYFIAMATAALPWVFTCVYFMVLLPSEYLTNWDAWKENLLLSRFAAPTSAGILFTMLAAAGLKQQWIYKKIQVLAIFDDLDTILLMIPLQVMMVGFKWQLFVIVFVVTLLLWIGWKYMGRLNIGQTWKHILAYGAVIYGITAVVYSVTKHFFGVDEGIHIEVLLPAFIFGMIMKEHHIVSNEEIRVHNLVSYLFMFLVGTSMPLFIGAITPEGTSIISQALPNMSWGAIILNVILVTALSNVGKMVPVFFYRDRAFKERLALSIGMFTRGEVGAAIIFLALGYNLGGPLLIISTLTIALNLILTGLFIMLSRSLALSVYGKQEISKGEDIIM
ncbi:MAG: sodium:proton antiporter [Bacteroidales bacterium]